MRVGKIDVSKIDKSAIFEGKQGKYIDVVIWDNKDGRDRFGWDGSIQQDIGKERRNAGEKGPYIGNWKDTDRNEAQTTYQPRQQSAPAQHTGGFHDSDDIPFAPFEKACRVPL